ncbi:MAG: cardiolipin synthase [Treponema sp.]|nr:cardiolipin synthase [Treponema sp.]
MNTSINIPSLIQLIISVIDYAFIFFILFFERKEATRRFAWIMILAFLPGVGIILYVLFSGNFFAGNRSMKEINKYVHNLAEPLFDEQRKLLNSPDAQLPPAVSKEFHPLITMNLERGNCPLIATDKPELFASGEDFFEDLCTNLEQAKTSICMEYFIFHKDKIGKRIMDILCRKAKEGIDVKLIYDDFGSILTPTRFFRKLNQCGGRARPFYQIRLGLPLTLNHRNHRKLTVIDSQIAYTGGINIGDEYANRAKHRKLNWRDTVVRLTGDIVYDLQSRFLIDWYSMDAWHRHSKTERKIEKYFPKERFGDIYKKHGGIDLLSHGNIYTQVLNAGPDDEHKGKIEDALIRMIMGAKKRVCIETPYFTPDEQFYTALKIAAYTGVKVDIIIPSEWDKFFMKAASSEFARQALHDGINIYLYPGFIHSKLLVADQKICTVGTTNIDNRSFTLHFEQNVIFYDKGFSQKCQQMFDKDLAVSTAPDTRYYDKKNIFFRAFWSFCKLFSPFM